jgi:DNA-3-methyladenine glycosylase I
LKIKKEFGSFYAWLEYNHPKTIDEWVKIFKKKFKFVGGEIVNEFLMSIGFLDGAHCVVCPTRNKIIQKNPKWLNV